MVDVINMRGYVSASMNCCLMSEPGFPPPRCRSLHIAFLGGGGIWDIAAQATAQTTPFLCNFSVLLNSGFYLICAAPAASIPLFRRHLHGQVGALGRDVVTPLHRQVAVGVDDQPVRPRTQLVNRT